MLVSECNTSTGLQFEQNYAISNGKIRSHAFDFFFIFFFHKKEIFCVWFSGDIDVFGWMMDVDCLIGEFLVRKFWILRGFCVRSKIAELDLDIDAIWVFWGWYECAPFIHGLQRGECASHSTIIAKAIFNLRVIADNQTIKGIIDAINHHHSVHQRFVNRHFEPQN